MVEVHRRGGACLRHRTALASFAVATALALQQYTNYGVIVVAGVTLVPSKRWIQLLDTLCRSMGECRVEVSATEPERGRRRRREGITTFFPLFCWFLYGETGYKRLRCRFFSAVSLFLDRASRNRVCPAGVLTICSSHVHTNFQSPTSVFCGTDFFFVNFAQPDRFASLSSRFPRFSLCVRVCEVNVWRRFRSKTPRHSVTAAATIIGSVLSEYDPLWSIFRYTYTSLTHMCITLSGFLLGIATAVRRPGASLTACACK